MIKMAARCSWVSSQSIRAYLQPDLTNIVAMATGENQLEIMEITDDAVKAPKDNLDIIDNIAPSKDSIVEADKLEAPEPAKEQHANMEPNQGVLHKRVQKIVHFYVNVDNMQNANPQLEHAIQWGYIRSYRVRDDLLHLMSDEISSSSSDFSEIAGSSGEEPMDTADNTVTDSNDVSLNGEQSNKTNSIEDPDVSTSGIRMNENGAEIAASKRNIVEVVNDGIVHVNNYINARYNHVQGHHDKIRARVWKMIKKAPRGIYSRELFKKYKKRYGTSLRYKDKKFVSPVHLMEEMGLRVLITRPLGRAGDYLLTVGPVEAPGPVDLSEPDIEAPLAGALMGREDVIPAIPHDQFWLGQLFLATIGRITSPSDFILVRHGDDNEVPLERMSNEMTEFYDREGNNLPNITVEENMFCGASYAGIWHRARIVEIIGAGHVKICHVDYGTYDIVAVRDIKPLLRRWAELPIQAIKARLDCVGPPAPAQDWTVEGIEAFEGFVINKPLFVHILGLDIANPDEMVAEVSMVDTSHREDRWIDMELVKSGLADDLREREHPVHRRFRVA